MPDPDATGANVAASLASVMVPLFLQFGLAIITFRLRPSPLMGLSSLVYLLGAVAIPFYRFRDVALYMAVIYAPFTIVMLGYPRNMGLSRRPAAVTSSWPWQTRL